MPRKKINHMGKALYIAEKPSVAREFAKALKVSAKNQDGYMESEKEIITWCVGHLITMSYPEAYDPSLKKWAFETLPFLPDTFRYEVISDVKKQFQIVKGLLNRKDVDTIYVCTDSGREGEYIYRLVDEMAKVPASKRKKRVWIDSQTEDEILRGIRDAKPLSAYDNLSASAYLRAKEDYLMGINFSRALSLKYGQLVNNSLKSKQWTSISVGRVMTCVLGMVVRREQEIREFVKTPFYRVVGSFSKPGGRQDFQAEWKAVEGSRYFASPLLYKDNGWKKEEDAKHLIKELQNTEAFPLEAVIEKVEKKKENKQPPLLFNLAELQNVCSKMFKISPDETLKIVQELYEKKLVTYPRTDARVLSTAVCKELHRNLGGLRNFGMVKEFAAHILETGTYRSLAKTKYVNDNQITDHYAIIPTGQGMGALAGLSPLSAKVYETIVRRFLAVFYPPAVYQKINIQIKRLQESFFANGKQLVSEGYLEVMRYSFFSKGNQEKKDVGGGAARPEGAENLQLAALTGDLKKGMKVELRELEIKEGETSPPKRYNSGSMILAMENAGQLIEDEELRAQIKGSGIGTSATRAEILNKLIKIAYLSLNKKTQVITPTLKGEMIYYVVIFSIRSLLNPELTASWEKGLTQVAEGAISEDEYMKKLKGFVIRNTDVVKQSSHQTALKQWFAKAASYYEGGSK